MSGFNVLRGILISVALLVGCSHREANPCRLQEAIAKLEMLHNITRDVPEEGVSILHEYVDSQCVQIVGEVSSPSELKRLFEECFVRDLAFMQWTAAKYPDRLGMLHVYHDSLVHNIPFRLARIGSSEAIAVLIDLRRDPRWQDWADITGSLSEALIRCGKQALVQLEEAHRRDPQDGTVTMMIHMMKEHMHG